ncbi:hypothetical protein JCM8547_002213 [Rhodosporidiobolus lusitaniae]
MQRALRPLVYAKRASLPRPRSLVPTCPFSVCLPSSSSFPSAASSSLVPTIFAPATGRGKSAISILRISGPGATDVWTRMTRPPRGEKGKAKEGREGPPERRAVLRRIVHPETEEVLDEAVVLFFPAHSSLTAQPTLELHLHGSPALMTFLLRFLPSLSTPPSSSSSSSSSSAGESSLFRIAEPGEFTRLAFEAGKMDLTEVEGIRDLVEAETEQQRKLAARQASGHIGAAYDKMREKAIEAMALVEALIDFGEDEGISTGVFEQAREKALNLQRQIEKHLADGRRGEIIRSGIQLAIIGPPNAGKSSLLNWLAQREAAIVTSIPGTTRDVVELSLDFHGFPVQVADTAGLRGTRDEVERIGIERAVQKTETADLTLCVLSLSDLFPPNSSSSSFSLPPSLDSRTLSLLRASTLLILNKSDASPPTPEQLDALVAALEEKGADWIGRERGREGVCCVSVKEGEGLRDLGEKLRGEVEKRFNLSDDMDETPIVTHERHRRGLEECLSSLDAFLSLDPTDPDLVDAGEELRYAVLALGKITGAVDVEEVLGEIFRGFCIGK